MLVRDGRGHILSELGFTIRIAGDELHGRGDVVPEMCVPGTDVVRTAVLAAWADHLAGLLVVAQIAPRVPVTLELDVERYEEAPGTDAVRAVARLVKVGRSVVVASVDFVTDDGAPLAVAAASFVPSPDATLVVPSLTESVAFTHDRRPTLAMPLAARARIERPAPGVAALPRADDGMNASNTVNGGLIALAVEEATLSASPAGATISSLDMRYLRPIRTGPAVATADIHAGLARVEVRDAGSGDRLAVLATTRIFAPSRRNG